MPRPVRMLNALEIFFVTVRCFQRRYLLRPSAETNEVLGGVLARSVRLHGLELFAFSVVSNHIHLVVRAPRANLPRFMQYLLTNVSKKVGKLVGWRRSFWKRRYSAERSSTRPRCSSAWIRALARREGGPRSTLSRVAWPELLAASARRPAEDFPVVRLDAPFERKRAPGRPPAARQPVGDPEELRLTPLPNPALQSRHALRSFLERSVESNRGTGVAPVPGRPREGWGVETATAGKTAGGVQAQATATLPHVDSGAARGLPRALSNVRRAVSQSIGPMEERRPDGFVPRSGNQTVRVAELRSDASRRLKLESRMPLTRRLAPARGPRGSV